MNILILGATSAIAQETAKYWAKEGANLFLVARDKEKLSSIALDLQVRGASRIVEYPLDLAHIEVHPQLIQTVIHNLGSLDVAFIAYGTLSDQKKCMQSTAQTLKEFNTNCTSVISLLTLLANFFETQKKGCLAVITSVAGDRGRQSNYVYGAAKGAVSLFMQGLRNRLSRAGVTVLTIKPGFVDTPMTAHIPKSPLFANPQTVGKLIYQAVKNQKDVVYIPRFWEFIMTIIHYIPERIFKRLEL
jgi:short-subunit dehydrogenase